MKMMGVFGSGENPGVLVHVDGKTRRFGKNDRIGNWMLKSVTDRSATFVQGSQTRVIDLKFSRLATGNVSPANNPPPGGVPPASTGVQMPAVDGANGTNGNIPVPGAPPSASFGGGAAFGGGVRTVPSR
jgi:hypothetical protein